MAVTITITTAGSSTSDPLGVYTSPDNIVWTLDANVAKATLLTGYTFTPPVGTYYYQVRDLGECGTILSLNCTTTTTSTSTTTTTTTTATPTTTTTTTTGGTPSATINFTNSTTDSLSPYNISVQLAGGVIQTIYLDSYTTGTTIVYTIGTGLSLLFQWLSAFSGTTTRIRIVGGSAIPTCQEMNGLDNVNFTIDVANGDVIDVYIEEASC